MSRGSGYPADNVERSYGQGSIAWFSLVALLAILVLVQISKWYAVHRLGVRGKSTHVGHAQPLSPGRTGFAISILLLLIFSKYFYLASIGSYFTFYLMSKFHLDQAAIFEEHLGVAAVDDGQLGIGRLALIFVAEAAAQADHARGSAPSGNPQRAMSIWCTPWLPISPLPKSQNQCQL